MILQQIWQQLSKWLLTNNEIVLGIIVILKPFWIYWKHWNRVLKQVVDTWYLYFSQKQLPSAWNESDWLTNCRPIHIVKLRENRKRFSWKLYKFMAYKVFWRMTSIRKIQKQNTCLHVYMFYMLKKVFHCNNCNALYVNVHFTAYQWHSKGVVRPGRDF